MAEDETLPGWPKKRLVKDVRKHLWRHGIRPVRIDIWRATWKWADAVAHSYYSARWPLPSEIGTQYIFLLLLEMQRSHLLRLPYRAKTVLRPEVTSFLSLAQCPEVPALASDVSAVGVDREERNPTWLKIPNQRTF